jgi:hypothetical protein
VTDPTIATDGGVAYPVGERDAYGRTLPPLPTSASCAAFGRDGGVEVVAGIWVQA